MRYPFVATLYPFLATLYPFLATHYPFLATHYPFPATHYPFPATLYPFLATHYPLVAVHRASVGHRHPQRATLLPFAEHRDALAAIPEELREARRVLGATAPRRGECKRSRRSIVWSRISHEPFYARPLLRIVTYEFASTPPSRARTSREAVAPRRHRAAATGDAGLDERAAPR
jgi:hypothetical protein